MNLIIDEGNTLVKMAVFQNDSLMSRQSFPKKEFSENFKKTCKGFPHISNSILSSVGSGRQEFQDIVKRSLPLILLNSQTRLPFDNRYATPASLGKDRIALTAAAVKAFPGENALVIDAGTCITYDFKTKDEVYLGGAISPGLAMRFESLHKFTANLPLVKPKPEAELIGDTTENSILSGIMNGISMELKGQIEAYRSRYDGLKVIFTGGDSQILSIPLKNSIFANSNFLLEGLNFILEFNKTQ